MAGTASVDDDDDDSEETWPGTPPSWLVGFRVLLWALVAIPAFLYGLDAVVRPLLLGRGPAEVPLVNAAVLFLFALAAHSLDRVASAGRY